MSSKQSIYEAALDAICDISFNGATAAEAALEMQRLAGKALADADRAADEIRAKPKKPESTTP